MLYIRGEQIAVFGKRAVQEASARIIASLLTHYPTASNALGGPPGVQAFVQRAILSAAPFGIESEGALSVYIELLIQFGEKFERSPIRPWTLNILAHPILPGSAKVEAVRERHNELTQGRILIVS